VAFADTQARRLGADPRAFGDARGQRVVAGGDGGRHGEGPEWQGRARVLESESCHVRAEGREPRGDPSPIRLAEGPVRGPEELGHVEGREGDIAAAGGFGRRAYRRPVLPAASASTTMELTPKRAGTVTSSSPKASMVTVLPFTRTTSTALGSAMLATNRTASPGAATIISACSGTTHAMAGPGPVPSSGPASVGAAGSLPHPPTKSSSAAGTPLASPIPFMSSTWRTSHP